MNLARGLIGVVNLVLIQRLQEGLGSDLGGLKVAATEDANLLAVLQEVTLKLRRQVERLHRKGMRHAETAHRAQAQALVLSEEAVVDNFVQHVLMPGDQSGLRRGRE